MLLSGTEVAGSGSCLPLALALALKFQCFSADSSVQLSRIWELWTALLGEHGHAALWLQQVVPLEPSTSASVNLGASFNSFRWSLYWGVFTES